MKKFLKFSGFVAGALALVAFILMMATSAVVWQSGSTTVSFAGTLAIFGGDVDLAQAAALGATEAKPSVLALIAWILALVSILLECAALVLPLLKVKVSEKLLGLFNLIAVIGFVLAGVFMFIVVPTFYSAVGNNAPDAAKIGAGWVIGAILFIAAGVIAILPTALNFFGKKK